MHRLSLFKALAAAATISAVVAAQAGDAGTSTTIRGDRPNIIFVLSDDVGLGEISCYGADNHKTPNIDALAKSGIRYTRCFSEPLCGPSRATIMTGRYVFRTGMISNGSGNVLQPANEIMMPKVMKSAGYATAQVGKWSQLPLEPGDWGFDEYLRFAGSGKYWRSQSPTYTLNGKQTDLPEGKYLPDVMHEFVTDFITRHKDEPFYIYYAMSSIHGPIMKTPDTKPGNKDLYSDNVNYMDKLIGKLVAELERQKLRDKTLIVFVGDNGTARFGVERSTINGLHESGMKGTLLEGGSRVPMIVSWPGTTPSDKVTKNLIDFSDFFPTFAALAGAKLPEGVKIDGHSFANNLKGKLDPTRDWVYVELNGKWYARSQDWKLTRSGELFSMKDAPFIEAPISADTTNSAAIKGREQLQAVLTELNPAAGKQVSPEQNAILKSRKTRKQAAAGAIAGQEPGKAVKAGKGKNKAVAQGLTPADKAAKRQARKAKRQAAQLAASGGSAQTTGSATAQP